MSYKIYINLPVSNLEAATSFYEAIGFIKNPEFSDTNASGMSLDENIFVMLLTHEFFKGFLPHKEISDSHKTCEMMNGLQVESREVVDALFAKAIQAGGKKFRDPYDHGFMYGNAFEDLDGHIWEAFWMDPSQMEKK